MNNKTLKDYEKALDDEQPRNDFENVFENVLENYHEDFPEIEKVSLENCQINISEITNDKNVLLIEDDHYLARDYAFMLEANGFKVSFVLDSEQAIKVLLLYSNSFDFIIIDIRMNQGRYFSFWDTIGGIKTGVEISKLAGALSSKAVIVGLSNSQDAHDEAWFEAGERHFYFNKSDFHSKEFGKVLREISENLKESCDPITSISIAKEQLKNTIGVKEENRNIQVQINEFNFKDKVMRDKYEAGQAGAQGPNAKAENNTFNQIWEQKKSEVDLGQLAHELIILREALAKEAESNQDYIDIGNVANAQEEAESGNGVKAMQLLKATGKKTYDVAEKIGVNVAAAFIKSTIGI